MKKRAVSKIKVEDNEQDTLQQKIRGGEQDKSHQINGDNVQNVSVRDCGNGEYLNYMRILLVNRVSDFST